MNKAEFIQTLSGYVPEKLIDTLAENAEWDGFFYEESENKSDKQAPAHDLDVVPFMTSDIKNRGHRQKTQRAFVDIDFIPNSDNDEIKAIAKEQANRRRQIRYHLRSLPQQS